MLELCIDCLYKIVSNIFLCIYLSTLFICSLWHNLIVVHFNKKQDPRDTRSSITEVIPEGRFKMDVLSDDSGVEIDRSVTEPGHDQTYYDDKGQKISINENPFNDVLMSEDTKLVADLKYYYGQYNIEIEEFEVETDDGFVIDLWHMKRIEVHEETKMGPPIMMLHGLLQSSGSFASSGKKSLAYYFVQVGYDVWLGNNRCGLKSKWSTSNRKKVNMNSPSREKWNWDMHEMVKYDLKALITKVLSKVSYDKLTLVAHSQGTTQTFMGLVNGEEIYQDDKDGFKLIDKLENFVALAPAVYPGPLLNEKLFVRIMAKAVDHPLLFGNASFIPMMMFMRDLMVGTKSFSFLSYVMFNYLFDWNDMLWDKQLRDRHFLFSPVHVSVKLMQWWLSPNPNKTSFKYNSEVVFPDDKFWFPTKTLMEQNPKKDFHLNPEKSSADSFPRILIFIPKQDRLVDGERLINHFVNSEDHELFKIWYIEEYSHLDVLWAGDVIERIGKPMVHKMRQPSSAGDS